MRRDVRQGGFTLIELVVVITILGILAAFAVPRFASLDTQARVAAQQALGGSVRSAAALSHALWLAQGQPAALSMENGAVNNVTIVNGYPNNATIAAALNDFTGYTFAAGVFTRPGANPCLVTYAQAAAANTAPTVVLGAC